MLWVRRSWSSCSRNAYSNKIYLGRVCLALQAMAREGFGRASKTETCAALPAALPPLRERHVLALCWKGRSRSWSRGSSSGSSSGLGTDLYVEGLGGRLTWPRSFWQRPSVPDGEKCKKQTTGNRFVTSHVRVGFQASSGHFVVSCFQVFSLCPAVEQVIISFSREKK